MFILDQHFERILVISLARSPERAERAIQELRQKSLSEKVQIARAVDGKICPPSDWWTAGSGAWGCYQSHYRIVQEALLDGIESLLVIEDDCIWQRHAAKMAEEFLPNVPDDWGQIYFGGVHRGRRPTWLPGKPSVLTCHSVNRTHAYAIHKRAMPKFLQHIAYAPDYIDAKKRTGKGWHVDHQLETAHQRRDWPVYAPSWWLAGQGENLSTINGRNEPESWWQLVWREAHLKMPLVIVDHRPPTAEEMRHLHFGKHISKDEAWVDEGVRDCPTNEDLLRTMGIIAAEAASNQRLPGLPDLTGRNEKVAWVISKWMGPVIRLSENPDLEALCDFPKSKVLSHDWINPSTSRAAVVADPSESTDATAEEERRPMVHQVWLGPNEMHPRLAGYCETVEKAFPEWDYTLWGESDMPALAERAVLPEVVLGNVPCNIGVRADVVRLEILRQYGGVYFDCDIEALRDLRPLFTNPGFTYGDYFNGGPGNQVMAASEPNNPVVEMYLHRIKSAADLMADTQSKILKAAGPGRLSEVLNFYVGDWSKSSGFMIDGKTVGGIFSDGAVTSLYPPIFFPYWYSEGTWATFDPANHPDAWGAHHWQADWHPEKLAS